MSGAHLRRALSEILVTERSERSIGKGVRLATLHGAKGLEWRRVILVDDGDVRVDDDARRLWYVGMTRASLRLDIVARAGREGRIWEGIGEAVRVRDGGSSPRVRYQLVGLDQVWIDALGRDAAAPGHRVLEDLPYGEPVTLRDGALVVRGVVIGRLSRSAAPVWGERRPTLRFVAAARRDRAECDPTWQGLLEMERWWVPICEARWE